MLIQEHVVLGEIMLARKAILYLFGNYTICLPFTWQKKSH